MNTVEEVQKERKELLPGELLEMKYDWGGYSSGTIVMVVQEGSDEDSIRLLDIGEGVLSVPIGTATAVSVINNTRIVNSIKITRNESLVD